MRDGYGDWLQANFQSGTRTTQLSQARRLEDTYGDLDAHFERDKFASILADLAYTAADKSAGKSNPSKIPIEGSKLYESLAHLRSALGYYSRFRAAEGAQVGASASWPALDSMRHTFLQRCSDFVDFGQNEGTYYDTERAYKDALIREAETILEAATDDEDAQPVGNLFLALLDPKSSNFVGWRAYAQIAAGGEQAQKTVALALGQMVLSNDDVPSAVAAAADRIHPIIRDGAMGNPAFGQVRSLVTSAMALARPDEAICVKTRFMQRAAKALTGKVIFKPAVVSADEYREFLDLAVRIRDAMTGWGWSPRDLWDVQGFLWVVTDDTWAAQEGKPAGMSADDEEDGLMPDETKHPLNQILYGPPGTGKTYDSARIAVEICNGSAPSNRVPLMEEYGNLLKANRIAFTTFHQSIGYEEFVEGLRPTTEGTKDGEEGSTGGFNLVPRPGIFRRMAGLAEAELTRPAGGKGIDLKGRKFFKMSLGESASEADVYDAAVAGNYVTLGWGGDEDWADSKYDSRQAIVDRWKEIDPDMPASKGHVSQLSQLRTEVLPGSIVIVPDGNTSFRAIGLIEGDYYREPDTTEYAHRRKVRWLRVFDKPQSLDLIVDGSFTMRSLYSLPAGRINMEALSEMIATKSDAPNAEPKRFVLIIDEINRANISKVLGELITLLEPDKRIGAGANALSVTLPYSGDPFGIPKNLYIIGTMNTADRSIALLDTALRRRFHFKEMMPDYACLDREVGGIHLGELLTAINHRVEWLFDRDHQIGHAFFTDIMTKVALDQVMQTKVVPLLAEYFYEDWGKVRAALNDSGAWFVGVEKLAAPPMLQEEGEERSRYAINKGDIPIEGYLAASELA